MAYTGGAERPADEPAPDESLEEARQRAADEQRPYIEVTVKGKYADVVCDIAGTGHRFTTAAIEEIESLQAEQRAAADADPDHKSSVWTNVGRRGVPSGRIHSFRMMQKNTQTTYQHSLPIRKNGSELPDLRAINPSG